MPSAKSGPLGFIRPEIPSLVPGTTIRRRLDSRNKARRLPHSDCHRAGPGQGLFTPRQCSLDQRWGPTAPNL